MLSIRHLRKALTLVANVKPKHSMRHSIIFILIFVTGLLISSCNPCNNLDCLSSNFNGQFKIVGRTDGKNLVFGRDKIYDKSKIKFYSLKGSDTTFFELQTGVSYSELDSILNITFFPKTDIVYMRLSSNDTDTLNIFYKTYDSKCCGTITEITKFRLNNSVDIPGDQGTQEIKK